MAEQANVTALFPTPPPFYKHFTKTNLTQLRRLQKEPNTTISGPLTYLVPPPPPANDQYRSFGSTIDHHAPPPDLNSASIEQLYPATTTTSTTPNPQPHLLALSRSLLTTFLSLTGILAADPSRHADAVEDLRALVYNMHSLINAYRPHQARETLVLMLEERVEKVKGEIKAIEEGRVRVEKLLERLRREGEEMGGRVGVGNGSVGEGAEKEDEAEARRRERQKMLWERLEKELG